MPSWLLQVLSSSAFSMITVSGAILRICSQARIRELDRNPKAMEKIARERYFMKADDEDIFVLSDDGEDENPIKKHETTE